MGKVFLIASGKGGVGKTTVSSNLSAALADYGRVLVVDADFEMANLDLALGLRNEHVFDVQDVFFHRCLVEDALCSVPGHGNLSALFAPLRREAPISALYRFLHELLLELRTRFDYVFVDCPSGIGIALETLADPRFETLIVTTPDRTSVSDGERTADFLYSRSAGRVRLIVNRVRPALIKKSLAPDIDAIIDTTAIQLIGLIPEDVRVICAGNIDRLVIDVPRSRSRNAFRNIARRLQGESVDLDRFS